MTVNALAFYAVAVLIVLAAAAAVGLPSLRLASYGGAATVVLLAILDIVSGAYALAAIEIVIPGHRGGNRGPRAPPRTVPGPRRIHRCRLALVAWRAGRGCCRSGARRDPRNRRTLTGTRTSSSRSPRPSPLRHSSPCFITTRRMRWSSRSCLIAVTVAAGLVIGRRSSDEQTLDQHLQARREREERARRRRDDRQAGRRRPAKEDS